MFSSVGWGEVLVVIVVGIIVVGPERLPRLITDVKALILAARNTIANARKELDQDFGEEFEEFRKPLAQLNSVRQMGARGFITKTLLDDDDSFFNDLETSARDVSGAVQGTTARMSGDRRRVVPAPGEEAAKTPRGTAPAAKDSRSESRSGASSGSQSGSQSEAQSVSQPQSTAAAQPRVELPQQDEAGQSRDWSNQGNYEDTL